MKKRLLAIILSMTLFVLSVVGVGAVDATQGEDTISVVTMDPETGIESEKVYDLSGENIELLNETIISTREPMNLEGAPVSQITEQDLNGGVAPCAVFGSNDLTLVEDTEIEPYSAIAYLEVIYNDGFVGYGTCYLISKNVAITAAHCLYSEEHGGWPLSVAVFPGKTGVGFWNDPYESCYAGSWTISEKWLEIEQDDSYVDSDAELEAKRGHDWGIFKLMFPLGNSCNYIDIDAPNTANIENLSIKLSGYPARIDDNFPDCKQYEDDGTIVLCEYKNYANVLTNEETNNGIVYYNNVDTEGGQSGAPILYMKDGRYAACAIHSGGGYIETKQRNYNYATLITPYLYSYFTGFVAGAN